MKIEQAYTQWSETYDSDRNRTRDLDQSVTRQLLGPLRPAAILELGCGTGKNTAFLAEIGQHVHALDFSEGMLAKAREKVTLSHVTFAVADLTKPWPAATGTANLVVGNLVLEHIADLNFIFAEAARCLQPGGQLFFSELHPFRQYQGGQANFQHGTETTHIPAFQHHVSDYTKAAQAAGLTLAGLDEFWHAEDEGKPPRLLTVLFKK